MNCPECGKETPDDGKFCPHCGAPVVRPEAGVPLAGTPMELPSEVSELGSLHEEVMLWQGRPSLKPVIPWVVVMVVLIGVLYALGFFLARFLAERGREISSGFWTFLLPGLAIVLVLVMLVLVIRQWVRKLTVRYSVSSQRILLERGMFGKRNDELELEHYKDIVVHRRLLHGLVGCGDIRVITSDPRHGVVELSAISDPMEKKEIIRTAAESRKRELGIVRREEL